MRPIETRNLRIDRVVESSGPTYPPEVLLPELSPELLDRHRSWLEPVFADPISGLLGMSFHSYLIRTEHHTVLVDACVGNDKERPAFAEWHQQQWPFLDRLGACGVTPAEIDFVFCTHLHPDHVGWNTRLADGTWIPTFPNAQYVFYRSEWEHWSAYAAPDAEHDDAYPPPVREVMQACYRDSVAPVVAAGQSILVDAGHELAPGISIEGASGHTPGNTVVSIERGDFRAVLSGDVMHHPLQVVAPELSSGFCVDPVQSAVTRRALLERHRDSGAVILPAHFPDPTAIILDGSERGFHFRDEAAR